MDALNLTERILKTIEIGESQFREFKSAWEGPLSSKKRRDSKAIAKDISETLVAFANADGGELLIGVEDDGQITGISSGEDILARLLSAYVDGVHKDTPIHNVISRKVSINAQILLYFSTDKSTTTIHHTSDGKCLQRNDLENRPVSAVRLQFERQEQLSREYDRQFLDGAQITDLNLEIVKRISDGITRGMTPEKCLQYLGVAEYGQGALKLRRAALLLFAKNAEHWHPRCQVRVVRVPGVELKSGKEYQVVSDEVSRGNILELLTAAWEKLRPHLAQTKMVQDGLFREQIIYPEDACREALTNAIAHRDYSLEGQNIEIFIFDDRMEVSSPGGLLSSLSADALRKLQGVHESRNALVARVLREIGYVREMGEGMRRIFHLMLNADLVAPELVAELGRFKIILRHKSVFSDSDQQWLDGFKPIRLTRDEMHIALLGKAGNLLSPQQIYDELKLVDWDVYREIVEKIQAKGVVYNAISQYKKVRAAREKNVSQRQIPRLAIRHPDVVENDLGQLYVALKKLGSTPKVTKQYLQALLAQLPNGNSYKTDPLLVLGTFRCLGLVADNREPTAPLIAAWGRGAHTAAVSAPGPARRVSAPRQTVTGAARATASFAGNDIYVGNLDLDITEADLRGLFQTIGDVESASIPPDYVTQRSRGFGFVRMRNQADSEKAIAELNGRLLGKRSLRLSWAKGSHRA